MSGEFLMLMACTAVLVYCLIPAKKQPTPKTISSRDIIAAMVAKERKH